MSLCSQEKKKKKKADKWMLEGHLQKLTDEIYVTGTQMDLSALALSIAL